MEWRLSLLVLDQGWGQRLMLNQQGLSRQQEGARRPTGGDSESISAQSAAANPASIMSIRSGSKQLMFQ